MTWETLYSLFAKVTPVRGREIEHQGRLVTYETYLVNVRFLDSILATDRIVWRGKPLNIRTVQDREGKRRWLTIEAEAGLGT